MKWKILEINGKDALASNVRYKVTHEDVETEGYWHFDEPRSLEGATEEVVIEWVRQATKVDGENMIEKRVLEQVERLESIHLPWKAKTFTVTI